MLAHVPSYPPAVRAGSELSLHATLRYLVAQGQQVRVAFTDAGEAGTFDGVEVGAVSHDLAAQYQWSNCVVTQLAARTPAMRLAHRHRRPLVQFVRLGPIDEKASFGRPELVVYNAEWLRRRHQGPERTLVVHSPIAAAAYRTTPGTAITAVNLSATKGGRTFFDLASRLPDREFLGVHGAWGEQVRPRVVPDNVTLIETTSDVRSVYGRTRLLLVPSRAETFGRVAVEAACSGIPVVAHPSNGVCEAMGGAALYAEREEIDHWVAHIESLDDPEVYRSRSDAVRARAEQWTTDAELRGLEQALLEVVAGY